MDQIRMVKDENGDVFLSREDLLTAMNERLEKFPEEFEKLKQPQQGKVVGADGVAPTQMPDEKEIARHEGMEKMLKGIITMLDAKREEGEEKDDS